MRHLIKLAGAAALAIGLSTSGFAAEKLKVAFVYVGPVGDFGYSYQHNEGRLAVEKALGDKVETTFLESVPEPDSDRAIEQLVRAGNKLIFTTSFGYMEPTLKVAAKYPNVFFEHATGYKRSANVATYSAKFHEGRYVQGVIAGKLTKANVIGYVASFPIPEVVSGINAFMLGAQSVNKDIKVKIVWANTWFDPGKEADAAKALLDQGADIITQHTDSPAPLQQAEARGKLAFGQASDMIRFAPKTTLTSIVDNRLEQQPRPAPSQEPENATGKHERHINKRVLPKNKLQNSCNFRDIRKVLQQVHRAQIRKFEPRHGLPCRSHKPRPDQPR